ncbi:unnamed protein product [Microthlaspi erraticum]|uniref:F-box domain-containing protein n=1 Tax=Microthlaspi erraticum TaxID=1685480 RepID=A0A6D2HF03_9BRAS|nr:unnamed protein product [Microthlaspi erraticum]
MSDTPMGLAEDVPSRLPVTSVRGFRSACKKCNTISKDQSFTKKHLAKKRKKLPANLTMMSDLPKDLLEEILSRLPVTSRAKSGTLYTVVVALLSIT